MPSPLYHQENQMPGTTTITARWKSIWSDGHGTVAQCQDCYRNAPAARLRDGDECISGECVSAR